jgi:hypothetical protein
MRKALIPLLLCLTTSVATAADPPPTKAASTPAPTREPEPKEMPEPPPAPLRVEPEPPAEPSREDAPRVRQLPPLPAAARPYRIGGFIGVGLTLAFVVSGTVLGVLSQRDSDALMRLTSERVDDKPVIYDAERQMQYETLSSQGAAKNRATIACFIVAGVSAVASGVLFWDASRRVAEQKQSLALIPAISTENREARLLLSGRF